METCQLQNWMKKDENESYVKKKTNPIISTVARKKLPEIVISLNSLTCGRGLRNAARSLADICPCVCFPAEPAADVRRVRRPVPVRASVPGVRVRLRAAGALRPGDHPAARVRALQHPLHRVRHQSLPPLRVPGRPVRQDARVSRERV